MRQRVLEETSATGHRAALSESCFIADSLRDYWRGNRNVGMTALGVRSKGNIHILHRPTQERRAWLIVHYTVYKNLLYVIIRCYGGNCRCIICIVSLLSGYLLTDLLGGGAVHSS